MAGTNSRLQIEVVTRSERLWHGVGASVVVPAAEGELGILPGRAPILTVLQPGRVSIITETDENILIEVTEGFASVDSNYVTIVVNEGRLETTGSVLDVQ